MKTLKQFQLMITAFVFASLSFTACSIKRDDSSKDLPVIRIKHIDGHAERMSMLELTPMFNELYLNKNQVQ
jgi:hypothetical protein